MKGKLWYWGSYGKQDIKAGILASTCRMRTARP